jgi:hypothetical protein
MGDIPKVNCGRTANLHTRMRLKRRQLEADNDNS